MVVYDQKFVEEMLYKNNNLQFQENDILFDLN